VCHLIFFAPILALPLFWLVPLAVALPAYVAVLFFTGLVLWPAVVALRRPLVTGREAMVGARGETLTALNPGGLIRCQGEVWRAQAEGFIAAGERVHVLGVERLRVHVARDSFSGRVEGPDR
jgi:membrane-bound serine protease (ClpP class)